MYRRWMSVFLTAVVWAATVHAQDVVRNGGFTSAAARVGDGSIPPNQVSAWAAAYRTPQLVVGAGCQDPNFIAMWGNKAAGEAITQPVSLKKGVTYDVSICARYHDSNIPYSHVELRASTLPLRDPSCPADTCGRIGGAKNVSKSWTTYSFQFVPSRDYSQLTVNTTNDIGVDDGAFVSWSDVDNISIVPSGSGGQLAPLLNAQSATAVPNQYIVVLKPDAVSAMSSVEETIRKFEGQVLFRYTRALFGLSVRIPPSALPVLRALPGVAWIELDQKVTTQVVQTNPPKGLDRTSERLLPLDNRYTYSETGAGVHAYVIDTGIRITHAEFGGRASGAFTAISDGNGTNDCNGHGTHVAGTIGGTTFGIAKQVALHAVRVLDCGGSGTWSGVIAGIDWVTNNRILPAVANMSLGGGISTAVNTAVTNSIASGVTYAVAAGNSFGANACNFSPASTPNAITVGAVDPTNDTTASFSNIGPCVDLFGPGVNILSSWNTSDTATNTISGTSMASPHVAGVAARYLQNHTAATPAMVWTAIHHADDVSSTPGWSGVINPGAGSPNELLHWGSLNDGFDDGDPHLTTVNGVHYNFQSAGEFVSLRDGDGLEIQTRQTPVATTFNPGPDPYDGLATCVSLNTAVAARVGPHRVTYEPNINGVPDPSGLQLRVDGVLTTLPPEGLTLAGGGRVLKAPVGDGIEIDFPDDTVLFATPAWWASQSKWYMNVHVTHTPATGGILGEIRSGSWLPALSNGTLLGPLPSSLHQRYVDLNQTFADSWRVTPSTSLFDYAPGTSTATFTLRSWPPENGPCTIPNTPTAQPATTEVAQKACSPLVADDLKTNCTFDVRVTGETGFAKVYLVSQQLRAGATRTTITDDRDQTSLGTTGTFTAAVIPLSSTAKGVPTGTVQFFVDGVKTGNVVRLGANGQATWKGALLVAGTHRVAAAYVPDFESSFLPSRSGDITALFAVCITERAPASAQ